MKQTLKRLLPIFLSLVVICSIIWYLFGYDQGFMQDVLLSSAHFFEEKGNHSMATWLYNQAFLRSDGDDSVIIELAERFKKIGNYTQAEVTLSNAIAEGGSVELYIALSKTYVEQDKLMDAVNMLNNVTNSEIKAQLDTMRPSAPVATPEPGYYNQYISAAIESAESLPIYVSSNKEYPSLQTPYQAPVDLTGGENRICAIAVDENGLVSIPSYFTYIIGGVIEEVTISDPILDLHLRDLLNMTADEKLFSDDLWTITSLTVPDGVTDYSDLSRLVYLESLTLNNPKIDGLQALSALTQLKELTIQGCPLSAADLTIIGSLPKIETLILTNCSLSNISGLSNATQLVKLDLSSNAIKDLSPLSFMGQLSELYLNSNAVTNLSALSALENLSILDVSYNSLTSISPLGYCPKLCVLVATNNQISEIPAFQDPTVLVTLNLSNNDLTKIDTLSAFTSLTNLCLSYNAISDVTSLSGLNQLTSVDLSHNSITKLPSWKKSAALVELNASHNKITSVSPLSGLSCLNYVTLDYNKITNINPLAECRMLVKVSIYGNSVSDVSKLTDMSVIVNYNPM